MNTEHDPASAPSPRLQRWVHLSSVAEAVSFSPWSLHQSSSLHAVYYWAISDFPAAESQFQVLPIPHLYFSSSPASGGMFPRNLWCLSLTSVGDCFEYKIYNTRKYHDLISLLGYLVVLSFNFSDYKHCWAVIGYWMSSILNCWIRIYAYFKLQWAMKVLLQLYKFWMGF